MRYEASFLSSSSIFGVNFLPSAVLSVAARIVWRATGEAKLFEDGVANVYRDETVGKSFTWDMRVQYALPQTGPGEGYLNLGIENVTNRSNPLFQASETVYEKGRQFTLELGYRF